MMTVINFYLQVRPFRFLIYFRTFSYATSTMNNGAYKDVSFVLSAIDDQLMIKYHDDDAYKMKFVKET